MPENNEELSPEAVWAQVAAERSGETVTLPPETPPAETVPPAIVEAPAAPAAKVEAPVPAPANTELSITDLAARLAEMETANRQLLATQTDLLSNLKATTGRVGALQSEMDRVKKAPTAPTPAGPTAEQIAAATADPEEFVRMQAEYPSVALAMSKTIDSRIQHITKGALTPEQVDALVAERVQQVTATTAQEIGELKLELTYKDWRQRVKQPDFAEWRARQPAEVQALSRSADYNDAQQFLRHLRAYDDSRLAAETAAQAKAKAEAEAVQLLAEAKTSVPGKQPTITNPNELTGQALWDYEAEQRSKNR